MMGLKEQRGVNAYIDIAIVQTNNIIRSKPHARISQK